MTVRAGLRPLVLLLAVAVMAACNSDSGATGGETPEPHGGSGVLVYSRPDGIFEFDIDSGATTPIILPEAPTAFTLDPVVSPDGSKLAYIVQPPAVVVDGRYDAGSDLWVSDRDGSHAELLYEHEQPNALVRYPQWTADGDIVAIIQEIDDTPPLTTVSYTVQRIDIDTGQREKLLQDAYAFGLSPDGARIAYSRPEPRGGETFESAPVGGGPPMLILPATGNLQPFNSPRYSPDGATIAFASADQAAFLPMGHLASLAPMPAATDGLPQDIWLIDANGGQPRLLAELREDLPALTWNGDGTHIYVLGGTGLYDVNIVNFAVTRIGEGAFHGQLDWTP